MIIHAIFGVHGVLYIFYAWFYFIIKMLLFVCFSCLEVGWMYWKFLFSCSNLRATLASWILQFPLSTLLGHDIFSLVYTQLVHPAKDKDLMPQLR